jgi:hypothetical protein
MEVREVEVAAVAASVISRELRSTALSLHTLSLCDLGTSLAVDDSMERALLPLFAHLVATPSSISLTIRVAALRDEAARILELDTISESGHVVSEGSVVVHRVRDAVSRLDRDAGTIDALIRIDEQTVSWHRAKPLQVPLSIFLADRDIDLVHAGLVSIGGNGVLFAGTSGSGKSTASLACALAGFDFLGDDCVAVAAKDGSLTGYSLYASSAIEVDHLDSFGIEASTRQVPVILSRRSAAKDPLQMGERRARQGGPSLSTRFRMTDRGAKSVLTGELLGRCASPSTRLRAIVLPRVTREEHVSIERVSAREALLTLAPSSIVKRAVNPDAALKRMAAMVRALPCFRMHMGPIDEIAPRLEQLMKELL